MAMELEQALLAFGKWIGLFRQPDGTGNEGLVEIRWNWFGGPLAQSLDSMQQGRNRQHLAALMHALVNAEPAGSFNAGQQQDWAPFPIGTVWQGGLTWNNEETDALHLGLGFQNTSPDMAVLANVVSIENGAIRSRFGDLGFRGSLDFLFKPLLESARLSGQITSNPFDLDLTLSASSPSSRVHSLSSKSPWLVWDAARFVMFLIEAWTQQQETHNEFLRRVHRHLFPMFGESVDGPLSIKPFPLFQEEEQPPDFEDWCSSVLKDGNGAVEFLWHARALLTGNESPTFLDGSWYFPLHGEPVPGDKPPDPLKSNGKFADDDSATGAWLSIHTTSGIDKTIQILSIVLRKDRKTIHVELGQFTGGKLVNPSISQATIEALRSLGSIPLTKNDWQEVTITATEAGANVTLLEHNVADEPFTGVYGTGLTISDGNLGFNIKLPNGDLRLPASGSKEQMFALVAEWVLCGQHDQMVKAAADLFGTVRNSGTLSPSGTLGFLKALSGGNGGIAFDSGPLNITIAGDPQSPVIRAALDLKDLHVNPDTQALFTIGRVKAEVEIAVLTGDMETISLLLRDIRLRNPGGAGNKGLLAQLLPDLTDVPGVDLTVSGVPQPAVVEARGKIPVQKTLGTVNISSLQVDIRTNSLHLGIDLSFHLGPIRVSADGLGVDINFSEGTPRPSLRGLGVSLDTNVARLAGRFGAVTKGDGATEYIGAAVASVVDRFELAAIGGYSQGTDGNASMFIFASATAPLGGPPFLFITGIAGGFGFNRQLPPPGLLQAHPFMQVMSGEIQLSTDPGEALRALSDKFRSADGTYWLAAGIQFISFGFIHGKLIAAVQLGHQLAISVLGKLTFRIEPVANFEIDMEGFGNTSKFLIKSAVSPNSYIIHPDIFNLRADFAIGVWGDGDFVFSIGGFHAMYVVPQHYADLNLGRGVVKGLVGGVLSVSAECFFACTPQVLMAGAHMALTGDFAGMEAGLEVAVDVLITWDPYYIFAAVDVSVWFHFLGRHEVSVGLRVWTPPFGGIASIDLLLVSFDFSFGAPLRSDYNELPQLSDFLSRQLSVPAKGDGPAHLAIFNTKGAAGLIRVNFTAGRVNPEQRTQESPQDGVESAVLVTPEFAFTVVTRLPIAHPLIEQDQPARTIRLSGDTHLPLCGSGDRSNTLTVTLSHAVMPVVGPLKASFPVAEFGADEIAPVQAQDVGNRLSIASIATDRPTVELIEGATIAFEPMVDPKDPKALTSSDAFEHSADAETYPLPLKSKTPRPVQIVKSHGIPLRQPVRTPIAPGLRVPSPRPKPAEASSNSRDQPLTIVAATGTFVRESVRSRLHGQTLAEVPGGAMVITPPPSPIRISELYGVTLRITKPHLVKTTGAVRKTPRALRIPVSAQRQRIRVPNTVSPVIGPQDSFVLLPADVGEFNIAGGVIRRAVLKSRGTQIVRAIAVGRFDELLADVYIAPNQSADFPVTSRRIVVVGEGIWSAISTGAPARPLQSCGVEQKSNLLAINPRLFAGMGCLVQVYHALPWTPRRLDTIAACDVLANTRSARLLFPAPPGGWCLEITVRSQVAAPATATDQVRWKATRATLAGLITVVDAGRVAFLMTPKARGPWSLDVNLGPEWRLEGVALCDEPATDLAARLRTQQNWDCVDDRLEESPAGTRAEVTLEAAQ